LELRSVYKADVWSLDLVSSILVLIGLLPEASTILPGLSCPASLGSYSILFIFFQQDLSGVCMKKSDPTSQGDFR
jgi:hypothetical protein